MGKMTAQMVLYRLRELISLQQGDQDDLLGQSHGADDDGKQQLAAARSASWPGHSLPGQAVTQVRIMATTAMKTMLTIQRMAAGTVGPTEK